MSTLWRLAGVRREYSQKPANARYVEEVMEYFGPFREHPCVKVVSQLQQRWGAPMALAVHLTDTVNLEERVPFEPIPTAILHTWGPDGHIPASRVVREARGFVADAGFNRFRQAHKPLYRETESRHRRYIESEGHLEWFPSIFGHRPGLTLHIILCLQNAGCCYPAMVVLDERVEYYCLLGTPYWDEQGVPVPTKAGFGPIWTIVHEFVHLYTDESPYLSAEGMREAGERLLESVKDRLDLEAYGEWERVIDETVANAWVVRYELATRGKEAADKRAAYFVQKGFLWTPALAELLAEYENNRDDYAKFSSFVPRLMEFFREQAGL